jgi:pimeloyl-ACP methyl ester carboxylesterase
MQSSVGYPFPGREGNAWVMGHSYSELANSTVSAANGIDFAYRDTGGDDGAAPLVLLQHFRGNLDSWDPALADALGLGQVDLLGFSIGSFVAQEIALRRPALVRRLVLASSAPKGAAGLHGWAAAVIGAVGTPQTSPEEYLSVFFAPSDASQQAGKEALGRMYARTADRDKATSWATREAQYDAVCAWGIPDHAALERVSALEMPVFVANGDSDPMILPRYSYLLAGLIPQARLKIYQDSAHGFLFQHHAEFAADVTEFLA